MKSFFKNFLVSLVFLTLAEFVYADFEIPTLSKPVTDKAGLINPKTEALLNNLLKTIQSQGGSQIAVLTLSEIGDLTIEQASIKITDKWQLGTKEKDDGILIFVVKNIKRMRIEVGQGLEGDLPDALAKRIIDEVMTPLFKVGNFSDGILAGTYQVSLKTNPDLKIEDLFKGKVNSISNNSSRKNKKKSYSIFEIIFFIIALIFLLGTRSGRNLLFLFLIARSGGRGGSGGGFGGSGGYSGGGGGFSGGGASGGW